MMKTNYEILAFDDNTDGQAYLADIEYALGIQAAFKKAYKLSYQHDHICIVHADLFTTNVPLTFSETAPYSIIVEAGIRYEL